VAFFICVKKNIHSDFKHWQDIVILSYIAYSEIIVR